MGFDRLALGVMRVGVVFPGQGSQTVGMGADVIDAYPAAADLARRANDVLGYDLIAIMRDGHEERLRETRYSQPAIFVTNVLLCKAAGDALAPAVSAGHSFGEYCSLTIADALDFEEALRLVNERALAMHDAAERAPGAMTAILGLDAEPLRAAVERAAAESGGRVNLANFNAPGQIVISGDAAAVALAGTFALEAGAKRAIPLNVSGAWHSALMEPARAAFAPHVDGAAIRAPRFPVVSNVDAQPYADVESIRRNLIASVTAEVRWHETAQRLVAEGVDLVVEFGASAVLAPLFRRIPGAPKAIAVGNAGAVESLGATLAGAAA